MFSFTQFTKTLNEHTGWYRGGRPSMNDDRYNRQAKPTNIAKHRGPEGTTTIRIGKRKPIKTSRSSGGKNVQLKKEKYTFTSGGKLIKNEEPINETSREEDEQQTNFQKAKSPIDHTTPSDKDHTEFLKSAHMRARRHLHGLGEEDDKPHSLHDLRKKHDEHRKHAKNMSLPGNERDAHKAAARHYLTRINKLNDKQRTEIQNEEPINEVSKGLLKSYLKKAVGNPDRKQGADMAASKRTPLDVPGKANRRLALQTKIKATNEEPVSTMNAGEGGNRLQSYRASVSVKPSVKVEEEEGEENAHNLAYEVGENKTAKDIGESFARLPDGSAFFTATIGKKKLKEQDDVPPKFSKKANDSTTPDEKDPQLDETFMLEVSNEAPNLQRLTLTQENVHSTIAAIQHKKMLDLQNRATKAGTEAERKHFSERARHHHALHVKHHKLALGEESLEEVSREKIRNYREKAFKELGSKTLSAHKSMQRAIGMHTSGDKLRGTGIKVPATKNEESLAERSLTSSEKKTKEDNVHGMKKHTAEFKERYGKRWKSVIYATATKQAENEETTIKEAKADNTTPHMPPSGKILGTKTDSKIGAKKMEASPNIRTDKEKDEPLPPVKGSKTITGEKKDTINIDPIVVSSPSGVGQGQLGQTKSGSQ